LEALASGVPVLVFSDMGGIINHVQNGKNGFILNNIDELETFWREIDNHVPTILSMKTLLQQSDFHNWDIAVTRKRLEELSHKEVEQY
jgi:glycosyltransferase involved in cell wall biosynthesis